MLDNPKIAKVIDMADSRYPDRNIVAQYILPGMEHMMVTKDSIVLTVSESHDA